MKKYLYKQPETVLLSEVPESSILDGSVQGTLPDYGEEQDFTW